MATDYQGILAGLASASNTDPLDTSLGALKARAGVKQQQQMQMEQDVNQNAPVDGRAQAMYNQQANNRGVEGGFNWDAFMEAINEAGERQNMPSKIGGIQGLRQDVPGGISSNPYSSFNTNPYIPHPQQPQMGQQALQGLGRARLRGKAQTQGMNPASVVPGAVE